MGGNHFLVCITRNIEFHEKLKRMKVVAREISFKKGSTRFFHERGVLHVKQVGQCGVAFSGSWLCTTGGFGRVHMLQ